MSQASVHATTVEALLERYDLFLLDAYGVLVDASGALPGAGEFLTRLSASGKRFLIVSNDCSRSIATSLARYRGFGLPLADDQILNSGLLLRDHFERAGLRGARCIVLGPQDSSDYVEAAGGIVVAPDDATATVLVIGDDAGFPLLETLNDVVTVLFARLARGERTELLLPNPDLVYPRGADAFGIASGAVAALIEAVLTLRDPSGGLRFTTLGKPHTPIFEAAVARFPDVDRRRVVMIGDQLGTDILGADRFGLDSVLITTGIARPSELSSAAARPTFTLSSLRGSL